MRSLWKGALSFGLVNIPVRLYLATEKKDIKFRYLHNECMTPVQYRKHCPTCDREVQAEEIVLGYEYQKGRFVIITDEDMAGISSDAGKTVDILDFVDSSAIDPIYFDRAYYLEPSEGGEKAYALLVQAMRETGRTAMARVMIRSRESLAAVRVSDNMLVMSTMFFPDEIRSPAGLGIPGEGAGIQVHDNERKMAVSLIENLSAEFKAEKYQNRRRHALRELIEARVAGREVAEAPVTAAGNVVDLMEALKQSVKLAEKERKKAPRKRKAGGS